MTVHPIELESYEILRRRIDLGHLPHGARTVVERVIHASADLEYATSMVVEEAAVQAGVEALRRGARVVCDVEMVRAGISRLPAVCHLDGVGPVAPHGPTRSALAMRLAAEREGDGVVVAVGNAPTALFEALELIDAGWRPALLVALPVGFVGAAESKEAARRQTRTPVVSNVGEKGGSAVAAAAVNAMGRLAGGS